MDDDYQQYDDALLRPKAATWEEFRRGGGGGGYEPDREPTKLGKAFRNWACRLIKSEKNSLNKPSLTPAEYVAAREKQKELTKEFNRINGEPGIGATFAAVRTVFRYNFGLNAPARN